MEGVPVVSPREAVSKNFLTASRDEFLTTSSPHIWENSKAFCLTRLLAQLFPRVCVGGRLSKPRRLFPVLFKYRSENCHHSIMPNYLGEFSRSFHSVQYLNKYLPVNAFSSDSPMPYIPVTAGGKQKRYNKKNSSSYYITCKTHFFILVSDSIQNARKCMILYLRYWKCEINVFNGMLIYSADQTYVNVVKLGA